MLLVCLACVRVCLCLSMSVSVTVASDALNKQALFNKLFHF